MCFSTEASFGAGIVLSVIGVATIKQAQSPSSYFFSSLPIIFALQQFSEGFLWLALSHAYFAPLQQITTYVFLFLAQIIWPVLVPFSILLLEKNEKRKVALRTILWVGILLALYLGYCLINYNVEAKIDGYHIAYQQDYPPSLISYVAISYIIATIAPAFFSTVKKMKILGFAILISSVLAAIFYKNYLLSVWCFFASIISILVYVIVNQNKKIMIKNFSKSVQFYRTTDV
ncbi:MAG: DUF6629 family protein [Bacteroidota bacterium]